MELLRSLLNEDNAVSVADLPRHFDSGEEFYDFVYWKFNHPDTYVERQDRQGNWLAEIGGHPTIKVALYDDATRGGSGAVQWLDDDEEPLI